MAHDEIAADENTAVHDHVRLVEIVREKQNAQNTHPQDPDHDRDQDRVIMTTKVAEVVVMMIVEIDVVALLVRDVLEIFRGVVDRLRRFIVV